MVYGLNLRTVAFLTVAALTIVAGSTSAHADVVANAQISFNNLLITSSSGTIMFDGWTASSFAQAQNSLGQLDANCSAPPTCLDSGPGNMANAAGTVTYVSAVGSADASGLTGAASSLLHIPGLDTASANGSANAILTGSFEITGGTGNTDVTYSADLMRSLTLSTDAFGQNATSEVIFNLSRDGTPVLFSDDLHSIGPNSNFSTTVSGSLMNTETLAFNTPYSLLLEVDAESAGLNVTPEPVLFWPALAVFLACVGCYVNGLRRKERITEPKHLFVGNTTEDE